MTFDEWNAEPYARTFEDAWKAGAASRDAEIVELKKELYAISIALDDPRTDLTMTMVEVITDQHKESDQLREQVKMLRNELLWHKEHTYNPFEPDNQCNAHKRICEALAATAGLDGFVLCEKEPVAWYDKHGMVTHDPFEGAVPLYRAKEQGK